eukprot:TRINITY_DN33302_c0_g1_i1.p3 TRINITY_DN33302_c0_g1~~TRINITY_DN33302_c0_g1_i1.p3  ORF type:complete len:212 (+),score=23.79 TRINITY_DN33302_c0_g1_i1:86-721(+)
MLRYVKSLSTTPSEDSDQEDVNNNDSNGSSKASTFYPQKIPSINPDFEQNDVSMTLSDQQNEPSLITITEQQNEVSMTTFSEQQNDVSLVAISSQQNEVSVVVNSPQQEETQQLLSSDQQNEQNDVSTFVEVSTTPSAFRTKMVVLKDMGDLPSHFLLDGKESKFRNVCVAVGNQTQDLWVDNLFKNGNSQGVLQYNCGDVNISRDRFGVV